MLSTIVNKASTVFHRNVGFIATSTSCSDLPISDPVDVDEPQAYLQAVDAILQSGVPNHKGMHIRLCSSFDWDFLK